MNSIDALIDVLMYLIIIFSPIVALFLIAYVPVRLILGAIKLRKRNGEEK